MSDPTAVSAPRPSLVVGLRSLPWSAARFLRCRAAAVGQMVRRRPLVSASLLLLILAMAVAAPHLWAWYHWRQAEACLSHGRTRAARRHLSACLKVWPNSVPVRLRAARAARQAGDFQEAERQLAEAQHLQPNGSAELTRAWALHRAAVGDLGLVESFLRPAIRGGPSEGPAVCEALAEGYLRNYRGPDALAVLDVWQEQQPDNLRALSLRGDVWRQAEALAKAVPYYRHVLALDPEQDDVRRWLALCLLDGGQPAESLPHWLCLRQRRPEDADVLVHLARCRHRLGETEAARHLLEEVVAAHPDHVLALHSLGEVLLQTGEFADAQTHLRHALRIAPRDYKINALLAQLLRQQGRTADAEMQEEKTRQLEARWKHFRRLARELADHPDDPSRQCELGAALLDLGYDDLGHRWLLSAVRQDASCRRGHELLARWYEEHQDADRAAHHRHQAHLLTTSAPSAP
jgi:predicted Zn-dependent protease